MVDNEVGELEETVTVESEAEEIVGDVTDDPIIIADGLWMTVGGPAV